MNEELLMLLMGIMTTNPLEGLDGDLKARLFVKGQKKPTKLRFSFDLRSIANLLNEIAPDVDDEIVQPVP